VAPDGVRVVSDANLERTWQPGIDLPSAPGAPPVLEDFSQHYALGWVVGSYGGQRLIWHTGGTLGFSSLVAFLPEANLGVVLLTNRGGAAGGAFNVAALFRWLELGFDQPATFDAIVQARLAAATAGRPEFLAHLGEADPAAVTPYLGRYANPDLGEMTLTMQDGKLVMAADAMRSELRPQLNDDDTVAGYVPVDPPFGSVPPEFTLQLAQDADERPQIVMNVTADGGEPDLVYRFDPVAATATPTP
jgi:CubicO group peptidase (beta-lactamase class C family)